MVKIAILRHIFNSPYTYFPMREIKCVIHILKAECQENLQLTGTCTNSKKLQAFSCTFYNKWVQKGPLFGSKYLKIESNDLQFSACHLQEDSQSFPMVCITSMDNFV